MNGSINRPKIFISYSWQPSTNKNWVTEFAERLSNDGVHVIIDIWDTKEGDDKFAFMEQMVNNPEVMRVLLICNKEYKEKADNKKGGVGIESQIISSEIYERTEQKKFVPIVREYIDEKPCLPTFVSNRFFINFSEEDNFEDSYEQLMRNIFDKPKNTRPTIGTPPSYLFEENGVNLRTASKIKPIKDALIKDKKNYMVFVNDYVDNFILNLSDFIIPTETAINNTFDDEIIKKIAELKLLRDNYLSFVQTYVAYSDSIQVDFFHKLFEKILELMPQVASHDYFRFDHLKFFLYEIFLYTTSFLIKKEKYSELAFLLNNPYLIYNSKYEKTEMYTFIAFNSYIETFEHRKKRLNLNRISLRADLVNQNVNKEIASFDELIQIDILLYIVSCLNYNTEAHYPYWTPVLTVYTRIPKVPIIDKMISKRVFENLKIVLNVKDKVELEERLQDIRTKEIGIKSSFDYRIPDINHVIKTAEIGKYN